ncbi:MAG: hypothetical protein KBT27_12735, partial [Prevotellaceae bacterium]|nr:hypothetical protein [Candidatus Faecinaster equi]
HWSGWRPKTHPSIELRDDVSHPFLLGGIMNSEISFKSRVRDVIVENAKTYYSTFVEFDYLIFSEAFDNNEYYIISA